MLEIHVSIIAFSSLPATNFCCHLAPHAVLLRERFAFQDIPHDWLSGRQGSHLLVLYVLIKSTPRGFVIQLEMGNLLHSWMLLVAAVCNSDVNYSWSYSEAVWGPGFLYNAT